MWPAYEAAVRRRFGAKLSDGDAALLSRLLGMLIGRPEAGGK